MLKKTAKQKEEIIKEDEDDEDVDVASEIPEGVLKQDTWRRFPSGFWKSRKGTFTHGVTTLTKKEIPPEAEDGDLYEDTIYDHASLGGEMYTIPKVTLEGRDKMFKRIQKLKEKAALDNPVPTSTRYSGAYRLCGAIILERLPSLTRQKEKWELDYDNHRHARDAEESRAAYTWEDFRQYILDKAAQKGGTAAAAGSGAGRKERRKKDKETPAAADIVLQSAVKPKGPEEEIILTPEQARAIRQETEWLTFWENWQPSSRETQADRDNNRKSLDRALDKKLYLIVQKNRKNYAWQFPQGGWENGETMRGTVERELREELGSKVKAYFISNAPCGFYQYPFSEAAQEKYRAESSKVFFYRARHLDGDIELNKNEGLVDYLWVTAQELKEYFTPEYYARVRPLLNEEVYIAELKSD